MYALSASKGRRSFVMSFATKVEIERMSAELVRDGWVIEFVVRMVGLDTPDKAA